MYLYQGKLTSVPGEDFSLNITAGVFALSLHFRWDSANQEQYDIIHRALEDRRKSDPLLKDGDIIREYDWIDWYTSLPTDIEAALEEGMEYPQSLKGLVEDKSVMADELLLRKQEAEALRELIQPMIDQLVWNVDITDSDGNVVAGVVRPGGWLHNQDASWRLRFTSDLDSIGEDDLLKVTIEVEVAEE